MEVINNKDLNLPDIDATINFEQYTLIMKHEYIDDKGARHELEEPLCIRCIMGFSNSINLVFELNEVLEKMKHEVLKRATRIE